MRSCGDRGVIRFGVLAQLTRQKNDVVRKPGIHKVDMDPLRDCDASAVNHLRKIIVFEYVGHEGVGLEGIKHEQLLVEAGVQVCTEGDAIGGVVDTGIGIPIEEIHVVRIVPGRLCSWDQTCILAERVCDP